MLAVRPVHEVRGTRIPLLTWDRCPECGFPTRAGHHARSFLGERSWCPSCGARSLRRVGLILAAEPLEVFDCRSCPFSVLEPLC